MNIRFASMELATGCRIKSEMRRGLKDSLPVMLGFIPFALVLGAQAVQKGLSVATVPFMTGLNFGGGSEFAAMSVWTTPPNTALIVAMTFLVNSRHLLMGASLTPHISHIPMKKAFPALFFMCDESWAMALSDARIDPSGCVSLPYYMGVSISLYTTWITFTAFGAAVAPMIGDVEQYGFDMAFTAVFLVLLKGMWKGARGCRPWFVSLVAAGLSHLYIPGAWYVGIGATAGLASSFLFGESHD